MCCSPHHQQEVFCDLTTSDLKRLSPGFVKRHVECSNIFDKAVAVLDCSYVPYTALCTKEVHVKAGPLKGFDATVCVALRGSLMNRVSCSIYNNRPTVCRRAVVPRDKHCLELRRMILDAIEEDNE